MFDLIPKKKPESPKKGRKGFVPNSVPDDITKNFKEKKIENDEKIIIKYETIDEVIEEKDNWTTSKIPFEERAPRFDVLKVTMIEFDGTLDSKKVIEEGVEHLWWPREQAQTSEVYKTGHWTARQSVRNPDHQVWVKDITYTNTSPNYRPDPNLKKGEKEGVNEDGQFWKEEWERNDTTGYMRMNKMTEEGKHLR